MEILNMTACALAEAIKKKQIGVTEALRAVQRQINRQDNVLNAYISQTDSEELEKHAEKLQQQIDSGLQSGPLAGVPMGFKDNICVRGLPTTCASRILEPFRPTYTATAAQRLIVSGCLNLGKLNMDEFGMGSTTETSAFGPAHNPWDLSRSPGGSSGGAAAAVASGEAFFALASDTGGSIRQPCAFCGLTGIKPTYGIVSRFGLIAYASSFDQLGSVTKDALDCAAVLSLIAGKDSKDATSMAAPPIGLNEVKSFSLKGIKIGIPSDGLEALPDDIINTLNETAKKLCELGAKLKKIPPIGTDYALSAYYIIACAQAASNLARYDGVRYGKRCAEAESLEAMYRRTRSEGFGKEVRRRIMLGNFVLSQGYYDAYYKKALAAQARLSAKFTSVFNDVDFILTPVTTSTAPLLGESLQEPLKMYESDRFTVPANLCGLPAAAFPCGFDSSGLPIGMQLMGARLSDLRLLGAIHAFQCETDFHTRRPARITAKGGES